MKGTIKGLTYKDISNLEHVIATNKSKEINTTKVFENISEFRAAGGAAANPGPVWIGGKQYDSRFIFNKLPGFILIGDSIMALGNRSASCTAIATIGQTTATFTRATHNLQVGSMFQVQGFTQEEFNGVFTVLSVPTSSTVTAALSSPATVSTATGTAALTNLQTLNDNNPVTMANFLSGHKALYLGNFAMGGSKTGQLDYQITLGFNPANNLYGETPNFVFCSSGINDATTSVDIEITKSNLLAAIARVKNYGATFVYLSTPSMSNTGANWSVAAMQTARTLNKFMKELSDNTEDFIYLDYHKVCSDPSNQYGNYKSGYSTDGVHPNKKGAFKLATELLIPEIFSKIVSVDTRTLTPISLNLTLSGTSVTPDGTGASGVCADSYQLTAGGGGSQTVVGEKGIAASGSGESQRMAITAAAAGDYGRFRQISLPVTVGDVIIFKSRIRSSGFDTNVRELRNRLSTTNGSYAAASAMCESNEIIDWLDADIDFTGETPAFKLVAGTTAMDAALHAYWRLAGSGTVDISDFGVYKVG